MTERTREQDLPEPTPEEIELWWNEADGLETSDRRYTISRDFKDRRIQRLIHALQKRTAERAAAWTELGNAYSRAEAAEAREAEAYQRGTDDAVDYIRDFAARQERHYPEEAKTLSLAANGILVNAAAKVKP